MKRIELYFTVIGLVLYTTGLTGWHFLEAGEQAPAPAADFNKELGRAPDTVRRSSPRDTVQSFLSACDAGNFLDAVHCFNMSGFEKRKYNEDAIRKAGIDLARKLHQLHKKSLADAKSPGGAFEKPIFDTGSLSANPEGAFPETRPDSNEAVPENREVVGVIEYGKGNQLWMARYKDADNNIVWVFTPITVDSIAYWFGWKVQGNPPIEETAINPAKPAAPD